MFSACVLELRTYVLVSRTPLIDSQRLGVTVAASILASFENGQRARGSPRNLLLTPTSVQDGLAGVPSGTAYLGRVEAVCYFVVTMLDGVTQRSKGEIRVWRYRQLFSSDRRGR